MREFDILKRYPEPSQPRYVSPTLRTIKSRILAAYRDKDYYDGDRNNGYGGFYYDQRWIPIAQDICKEYGLDNTSTLLHIGCEKGFLLHDLHALYPKMKLCGTEISSYAMDNAMPSIKSFIKYGQFTQLPFKDKEFDFVFAISVVYTLNLADAMQCLREIQRVSKGRSFVTLAAYRNEEELRLFRYWTVLGCTILHEDEWVEVLKHVGYTGDYKFQTARSLKLIEKKD